MDTALPQKFPFIFDRNLAKANCTGNHVRTSCDTVVLDIYIFLREALPLAALLLLPQDRHGAGHHHEGGGTVARVGPRDLQRDKLG